jgi:hypothetical protein
MREESLQALDERLGELKPSLIVEAGSGQSTAVLARHGRTISLEHMKSYARASQALAPSAEVRYAPLKAFHTLAGNFRWYDTWLPTGIDFALIDGPPAERVGRQAALFALWPYLAPEWEIWLDDADRQHENMCLKIWHQFFQFQVVPVSKSVVRLLPQRVAAGHPAE